MGDRYRDEMCINCGEITIHRVFKRESPKKGRRREVVKCLECQTKTIDNRKRGKYRVIGEVRNPILNQNG